MYQGADLYYGVNSIGHDKFKKIDNDFMHEFLADNPRSTSYDNDDVEATVAVLKDDDDAGVDVMVIEATENRLEIEVMIIVNNS